MRGREVVREKMSIQSGNWNLEAAYVENETNGIIHKWK